MSESKVFSIKDIVMKSEGKEFFIKLKGFFNLDSQKKEEFSNLPVSFFETLLDHFSFNEEDNDFQEEEIFLLLRLVGQLTENIDYRRLLIEKGLMEKFKVLLKLSKFESSILCLLSCLIDKENKLLIGSNFMIYFLRNVLLNKDKDICIKRQAAENINLLIKHNKENKEILLEDKVMLKNLFSEVVNCGDFYLQGNIVEILYRLCIYKDFQNDLMKYIFDIDWVIDKFVGIRKNAQFTNDIQTFLNAYNESLVLKKRKVFSYKCKKVLIGKEQVNPKYIHFGDHYLSFTVVPKDFNEQEIIEIKLQNITDTMIGDRTISLTLKSKIDGFISVFDHLKDKLLIFLTKEDLSSFRENVQRKIITPHYVNNIPKSIPKEDLMETEDVGFEDKSEQPPKNPQKRRLNRRKRKFDDIDKPLPGTNFLANIDFSQEEQALEEEDDDLKEIFQTLQKIVSYRKKKKRKVAEHTYGKAEKEIIEELQKYEQVCLKKRSDVITKAKPVIKKLENDLKSNSSEMKSLFQKFQKDISKRVKIHSDFSKELSMIKDKVTMKINSFYDEETNSFKALTKSIKEKVTKMEKKVEEIVDQDDVKLQKIESFLKGF